MLYNRIYLTAPFNPFYFFSLNDNRIIICILFLVSFVSSLTFPDQSDYPFIYRKLLLQIELIRQEETCAPVYLYVHLFRCNNDTLTVGTIFSYCLQRTSTSVINEYIIYFGIFSLLFFGENARVVCAHYSESCTNLSNGLSDHLRELHEN